MDSFGITHRIVAEDPDAPNHVYNGSCRLMGVFCSSVGLTGLPTDPPPPLVIGTIVPGSGPDNTPITITGSGFGTEIGECKIGGEFVIVQTWTDAIITALASQGDKPSGVALPLTVARAGGEPVELPDAYAFVAGTVMADSVIASETQSVKGKKAAAKKKRRSVTAVEVEEQSVEATMPTFPSGAGIMLRDASGKTILVGPFELEAGRLYTLPAQCPNGLEVVPSGIFDITLLLLPPL